MNNKQKKLIKFILKNILNIAKNEKEKEFVSGDTFEVGKYKTITFNIPIEVLGELQAIEKLIEV